MDMDDFVIKEWWIKVIEPNENKKSYFSQFDQSFNDGFLKK